MALAQRLTAKAGDKLDLLLMREAGLGPDHLTRVMDANPGLVDLGPILPLGTVVIVPATSAIAGAPATRAVIQLWD
ncbi:tail protein X [Sphingobium sp. AN558]|uniref:tail protein X n=1 Tax=Sphingobium sp. AN558 TaxID=3133442 RepID=UPI0030BBB759